MPSIDYGQEMPQGPIIRQIVSRNIAGRLQFEALAPSTIHVVGGRVPLLTQGDGGDRRSLFGHITKFDILISIIVG